MHLSQMFPKKTLDAADLAAINQGVTVVTIEKIDFKTYEGDGPGDVEIAYFLHTREFKKPFRCGTTLAHMIAQVLRTEETDDWINQTVGLRPIYQRFNDKSTGKPRMVWIFDVDLAKPTTAPQLPPKQDITGAAAAIKGGPRPGITAPPASIPGAPQLASPTTTEAAPIGVDKAAAMVGALKERGKTVGDLVKHMATAGMDHLASGKIPPDWPVAILPSAMAFCRMFPKIAPPPGSAEIESIKQMWRPPAPEPTKAAAGEVVDRTTGEVIHPGKPDPVEINEEDIPF